MLTYSFENKGKDSLYESLYKQIRQVRKKKRNRTARIPKIIPRKIITAVNKHKTIIIFENKESFFFFSTPELGSAAFFRGIIKSGHLPVR